MTASIEKGIVSRRDHVYECFPDIAMTPDGTLICVYRECMAHAPTPFSRLVVRRSVDEGFAWSERRVLLEMVSGEEWVESHREWFEEDELAGYEETRARLTESWQDGGGINCSRLICLQDGSLYLTADIRIDGQGWVLMSWRSRDGGATWDGPREVSLTCSGLVPSLTQLRDGRLLLGLVIDTRPGDAPLDSYRPAVFHSDDSGRTWSEPTMLPDNDDYLPDEVSFVELDDSTLVGFGRNYALEMKRRPNTTACKVISRDGGRTWSGPFDTWLMGCDGRPKAGLLRSGEICITYRCGLPNEMLAMHVMTQQAAKTENLTALQERLPLPEDIPARRAREEGVERPWYMTSYYPGRTMILDMDRSVHRDAGYSGWVQLPNGDIFVVDYINDDAPLAHLRSYRVRRSDYILFPDGDLPWLHPSGQPFRRMTAAMAECQAHNI